MAAKTVLPVVNVLLRTASLRDIDTEASAAARGDAVAHIDATMLLRGEGLVTSALRNPEQFLRRHSMAANRRTGACGGDDCRLLQLRACREPPRWYCVMR